MHWSESLVWRIPRTTPSPSSTFSWILPLLQHCFSGMVAGLYFTCTIHNIYIYICVLDNIHISHVHIMYVYYMSISKKYIYIYDIFLQKYIYIYHIFDLDATWNKIWATQKTTHVGSDSWGLRLCEAISLIGLDKLF